MAPVTAPVSDMLVTVKAREIQRGMLAEMQGDRETSRRHLLAAAHLELVLAADYEQTGEQGLAVRSRISAASCFWRGGEFEKARDVFNSITQAEPTRQPEVEAVQTDLEQHYPSV